MDGILASLAAITLLGISLPFLVGWLVVFGLLSVVTYKEKFLCGKTAIAVGLLVVMFYFGAADGFSWRSLLSWWTPIIFVGWFAMGSAWLLFKWDKVSSKKLKELEEAWTKHLAFAQRDGGTAPTHEDKKRFAAKYIPYLNDNKERAFTWILLWPLSMVTYVLGDLIVDFLEWIVKNLGTLSRKVTRSHFGDLMDEPAQENKPA